MLFVSFVTVSDRFIADVLDGLSASEHEIEMEMDNMIREWEMWFNIEDACIKRKEKCTNAKWPQTINSVYTWNQMERTTICV